MLGGQVLLDTCSYPFLFVFRGFRILSLNLPDIHIPLATSTKQKYGTYQLWHKGQRKHSVFPRKPWKGEGPSWAFLFWRSFVNKEVKWIQKENQWARWIQLSSNEKMEVAYCVHISHRFPFHQFIWLATNLESRRLFLFQELNEHRDCSFGRDSWLVGGK